MFTIVLGFLALLLALASFRGDRARGAYFLDRLASRLPDADCPPATVIVPVKGADEDLAENLAALAALDYPDYELLVVVREEPDLPPNVLPPRARLVVAGPGDGVTSHKITNLLAAIAASSPKSQILAFADSDGRPSPGWLRALTAEMRDPAVGAATGYRWYVPQPPGFASHLRGVWNSAIAGTLGPGDNPFCWGGAMAITRANFERAQVRRHWMGQISDDFPLARAVHAAGLRVAFAPGAVVPSLDHTTLSEFFGWARRQLILTRVYAPKLWWQALIAHLIYVGAIATIRYYPYCWIALAVIGLGMLKAYRRAQLFHSLDPQLRSQAWVHACTVTLVTFLWLILLLASAFAPTIVWRGVRYRLQRPV